MKESISKKISAVSKSIIAFSAIAMVGAGFGIAALASAAGPVSSINTFQTSQSSSHPHRASGVHGTVSAINGTTLTVTSTNRKTSVVTTYTVDASAATVQKFAAPNSTVTSRTRPTPTTITVAQIAVGDTVSIQGTVSGTNVTATKIVDGAMGGFGRYHRGSRNTSTATSTQLN